MWARYVLRRPWIGLVALVALQPGRAACQAAPADGKQGVTGPAPQVQVDYFGAEHGYSVRRDDVVLLCVVHNVGGVQLPENTLRLHCLPLSGLDYTSGDTLPLVPALAPDQSVAYRWRLSVTEDGLPLIAAALIESTGGGAAQPNRSAANVALAVIPRLDALPRFGSPIPNADTAPQAGSSGGEAWVSSNRVGLRLLSSSRGEPLLVLAGRNGANWQTVAAGLPLARLMTCEEGQTPWLQSFRWQRTRTGADRDSATVTLVGVVGDCWHAEIDFTVHRDTGVIDGKLRLTAQRSALCRSVELPRLLATGGGSSSRADGTPILLSPAPDTLPEEARVSADRGNGVVFGLAWPSALPLPGWTWSRLPAGNGDTTHVLGAVCAGGARSDVIPAGGSLMFSFRLFASGPSDTVRDALRFTLP